MWTRFVLTSDVWTQYLVPGIIKTLQAAAISIVLALVFGLVFGMGRLSHTGAGPLVLRRRRRVLPRRARCC